MKIPIAVPAALVSCLFAVTPATAQVCGDNVRDVGEQCDDGATHNLDGCSSTCQFEQTHRINKLHLQRGTEPACTPNQLGGAFANNAAINTANNAIAAGVNAGATSILFQMLGLDDLAGTDDASLEVGILSASPVLAGTTGYNGASDLDWWYAPVEAMLDGDRLAADRLTGSITASALTAGPGAAELRLIMAGGPTSMSVSSLVVTMPIEASSTPLTSSGNSPGHLEAEQLDPSLQSFATAGTTATPADPGLGTLCGDVSALSLAQTPIPPGLLGAPCSNRFTAANSLLDVFVSGCNVAFVVPVINPTQPDQEDPAAPPAGAGPPYIFTFDAGTRVVTGCTANGSPANLADCLADAAYSTFFRFSSDRVIARDDLIFEDDFEAGV